MLIGKIASGKSTAANILKELGFTEYTFAFPIKEFAVNIGFNYCDVYGTQEEKNSINKNFGISGRQFMQLFGTDIMRKNSHLIFPTNIKNIWVESMRIKLAECPSPVVISDGRFIDEAKMISENGGYIIRLKRMSEFSSTHSSESEIDLIDADVDYDNNGTVDDLRTFLIGIISKGFTCIPSQCKEKVGETVHKF